MPSVYVIGRLQPGVPPDAARTELATVKLPELPVWATPFLAEQEPQLMRLTELARPETYWVMAIAAMLLYGIAC
jgi:hypothetical protein